MNKDIFAKYGEIKGKIKELTAEGAVIQKEILGQMKEADADKVETDFGNFSIINRKTYVYSENVKRKEEFIKEEQNDLKGIKKEEEETAEFKVSKGLMFKAK